MRIHILTGSDSSKTKNQKTNTQQTLTTKIQDKITVLPVTIKQIEKDTDRDNFLDAEAAKAYGIVAAILDSRDKKNAK